MDLPTFAQLLTPPGQAALGAAAALAPTEETFLPGLTRLQKDFPAPLAKAALETVILRGRARAKFDRADQMYFDREALEQSSGETIARYRAGRFAGLGLVADLGCGLGGDTLGLAARGPVVAVDQDPLRLALARANLHAYGYAEQAVFIHADLTAMQLPQAAGFFFDPARRAGGRRRFSVRDYHPPLAIVHAWRQHTPAIGVKISPGVDLAELASFDAEVEFISLEGELKECALWFGPLRTAARRATVLPGRHTLTPAGPVPRAPLSAPLAWLYEPDPSVLRAGLVGLLAEQLGAAQLDPDIAYLTAASLQPTPFARAYRIEEHFPFNLKTLRARLRELRVGQVTVKKRGSPLEPEELIHRLRLSGPESRIVFLTHLAGKPHILLAQPASEPRQPLPLPPSS